MMCGENEPDIPVYWFNNDGIVGPILPSIDDVLEEVCVTLESWSKDEAPITLKITTGKMSQKQYDALPEFEGY